MNGEGDDQTDVKLAGELVEAGGEFAGAAIGGALGLIGGPVGVVVGAGGGVLVTRTFKKVGAIVRQRWLDPRQEVRAGGAFALAAQKVQAQIDSGAKLRDDGFFEGAEGRRPAAEELLEGTLKTAADSYEERKVPYLANFYASLTTNQRVSPAYANHLLRTIEQLTWRQIVVLAFLDPDPPNFAERMADLLEEKSKRERDDVIALEFDGLARLGLVGISGGKGGSDAVNPQEAGAVARLETSAGPRPS